MQQPHPPADLERCAGDATGRSRDQQGTQAEAELIDEVGLDEGAEQAGAALAEDLRQSIPCERVDHRDGVDGVLVGPADLAASMGVPGQQSHPEVLAAVHRVFEAVTAAGKKVGVNAFDPAGADAYLAAGAHFLSASADVTILARGAEALAARFIPASAAAQTDTY